MLIRLTNMKAIDFVMSPPPIPSPLGGEGEGEGVSQTIAFMIGVMTEHSVISY